MSENHTSPDAEARPAPAVDEAPLPLEEIKKRVEAFKPWHHIMEIAPGVMTPGKYNPTRLFSFLELPQDMRGIRALDVGACDGFYTLEMHRRGAEVVALDYRERTVSGFSIMEAACGHTFQHINANVYDLANLGLGEFDVVLFLGVLYHLPDPVRALHLIRQVCRRDFFLETYVEDFGDRAAARYYTGKNLAGDITNFFAPNPLCVQAWMQDAGFEVTRTIPLVDRFIAHAKVDKPSYKMQLAYGLLTPKPKPVAPG